MLKKTLIAAAAVVGLSAGSAQASPFVECVSTDIVQFEGSIVDAAVATPALSTLVTAVTAAGLVETLDTAENITVYAPTNAAFAQLEGPILDTVLGNVELLTAVLTHHVTPGIHDPRRWIRPVRRETLAGQSVYYSFKNGQALVDNAVADCTGVRTDNGIVWIVDAVLLPALNG